MIGMGLLGFSMDGALQRRLGIILIVVGEFCHLGETMSRRGPFTEDLVIKIAVSYLETGRSPHIGKEV